MSGPDAHLPHHVRVSPGCSVTRRWVWAAASPLVMVASSPAASPRAADHVLPVVPRGGPFGRAGGHYCQEVDFGYRSASGLLLQHQILEVALHCSGRRQGSQERERELSGFSRKPLSLAGGLPALSPHPTPRRPLGASPSLSSEAFALPGSWLAQTCSRQGRCPPAEGSHRRREGQRQE